MYPMNRQVAPINSGHTFHFQDPTSTNAISSTTTESSSVRSAAEYISRFMLIFVPSISCKQINSIEDDGTQSGSKTPAVILSTFFNFSFYLCFSPFKFIQDEYGNFRLHRFLPQQILCIFISITSILIRLAEFRESWPNKPHESWNPVSYFRVSNSLSNLIFHVVILITLWIYNSHILDILNYFQRPKNYIFLNKSWRVKAPSLTVMFCILNAIVGTACFLFGTDILATSSWYPDHLYKCLLHRAKYTLFLHNQQPCPNNANLPEISQMSALDHTMVIPFGVGLYFRRLNGLYEELFILVGAFTFWLSANAFSQGLEEGATARANESNNMWSTVYQKYCNLTELADLINNAYGPVYFVFTITSIFYYSINLDNLLVSDDILVRAKFIAFYSGLVLTYLLSADICRQVGYLEIWISKHLDEKSMSELSHKQLSLILHEIATTRVGMTGCHLFTITYSMVAQLAGVLITYFIISVQYRNL